MVGRDRDPRERQMVGRDRDRAPGQMVGRDRDPRERQMVGRDRDRDPRTRLICWAGAAPTRWSAGTPQEGRGSSAQGQALGPAIGDVGSAAGLRQAKRWPEAQAGRASALARSAPRPWTGRLCSPTRVQRPAGPSHNVPSRTCAATRCQRGRPRRENPCGTRPWRRNRRQGSPCFA